MHDGNDELLEIDAQISYIEIEAQALLALCRGGVDTRESLRAVVRERLAVQDKLRDIISTWLNGYEKPVVVEQQERTNDR